MKKTISKLLRKLLGTAPEPVTNVGAVLYPRDSYNVRRGPKDIHDTNDANIKPLDFKQVMQVEGATRMKRRW